MLSMTFVAAMLASSADYPKTIELDLGQTVELEVGYAVGSLCDDETIVHGEMKTGSQGNNVFAVTGLKAGTTLCRVGTTTGRPSVLLRIDVLPPATETGPGDETGQR